MKNEFSRKENVKVSNVVIKETEYIKVEFHGFYFLVNEKTVKFAKDLDKVIDIFNKGIENLDMIDRFMLLQIYNVAYHDSGKIEGISSLDSSSTNCGFCEMMRETAKNNPLHICGYCYDYAQEHDYKGINVLNRHSLNLLIMSTIEFTREELATLPGTQLIRINSSGDTQNFIYACNMINYIWAHPYTKTAYWAKNVIPVIQACDKYGKPKNVKLVQSSPIIGHTAKLAKYFDYVFTVYVTKEDVKKAVENGAMECNGKKCADCGYKCYLGLWENGANIAEFLRIKKADRESIIKYRNEVEVKNIA